MNIWMVKNEGERILHVLYWRVVVLSCCLNYNNKFDLVSLVFCFTYLEITCISLWFNSYEVIGKSMKIMSKIVLRINFICLGKIGQLVLGDKVQIEKACCIIFIWDAAELILTWSLLWIKIRIFFESWDFNII